MSFDSNTPVDPRVQIELEKLNSATDNINKFEVRLDEAKEEFKLLLKESIDRIKRASHKLGNSIQSAKPYYEARLYASQITKETYEAAANYDKAKSIHAAAKEMVYLAEQGLGEKSTLDTACQEMLTHATTRVNESQNDCTEMRNILKITQLKHEVANNRVAKLQSQLKSAIRASSLNIRRNLLMMNIISYQHELLFLPYYETRANCNGVLKEQQHLITKLESQVSESKTNYNEALKNLEKISEEIHQMRRKEKRENSFDDDASSTTSSTKDVCNNRKKIDISDEYLDFPPKLSKKASPIRQRQLDKHDCPHLLKDIEYIGNQSGRKNFDLNCLGYGRQSGSNDENDGEYLYSSNKGDITTISSDDIEQWTEIRLSNSNSTSSGYSQNNSILDDRTPVETDTSTSDDCGNRKVRIIKSEELTVDDEGNKKTEGISSWITKSSAKSPAGRRQSLDIIIDTGDRVKDAFAQGIQKIGKSLERRNSESEVASTESNDFFMFTRADHKDGLSDAQVENLLLDQDCSEMFQNVVNISK